MLHSFFENVFLSLVNCIGTFVRKDLTIHEGLFLDPVLFQESVVYFCSSPTALTAVAL